MKFFTVILLTIINASCTSETNYDGESTDKNNAKQSISDGADLTELSKAIALAKQNKDYRLLATSGRSTSIPGVDMRNSQTLIKLCGKKYNPEVGDVITSAEQRVERKKHLDFMRQYNEQMLVICRDNLAR